MDFLKIDDCVLWAHVSTNRGQGVGELPSPLTQGDVGVAARLLMPQQWCSGVFSLFHRSFPSHLSCCPSPTHNTQASLSPLPDLTTVLHPTKRHFRI